MQGLVVAVASVGLDQAAVQLLVLLRLASHAEALLEVVANRLPIQSAELPHRIDGLGD